MSVLAKKCCYYHPDADLVDNRICSTCGLEVEDNKMCEKFDEFNREYCRYHPNAYLVGDRTCSVCGLEVIELDIDFSSELKKLSEVALEQLRADTFESYLLGDDAILSTSVQLRGRNNSSYARSIVKKFNAQRMDNVLMSAFRRIDTISDKIHLPKSIVMHAKYLYTEQQIKRGLKGNILLYDAKIPACIFIACQEEGVPRSLKTLVAVSDETKKRVVSAIKTISKALKLDITP